MAKFDYIDPAANDPIRIEQVFAEKPGGGVVHVESNLPATTPVKANADGTYEPIAASDTTSVPVYVTGNDLKAEDGDYQPVRLINGANLRKETCIIKAAQAAKMNGINLV